jgi:hypothetical protein
MLKSRLKNILTDRGLVLTILLTVFCMFFFLGKLLVHPNEIYFKASDDGIQAYYGALYHVKYDAAYWQFQGMNYPYGEQVFFTGCQPLIANAIKLISTVVDISNYTVGIINMIMLLSIALCPIFLYLIFKHLKLPPIFAAVAAVAITFLSPQFIRMGGHYSLTYQFAIPLFLLLLLKFYESPSIKKSVVISVLMFFMAGTQFYFFGFFAIISFAYWLFLFFQTNSLFTESYLEKIKFCAKHIFIQLILPFLLVQCLMLLGDSAQDRTQQPWGYLNYFTNLAGVFFPLDKPPYTDFLLKFIKPEYPPSMEGYSYVGLVATLSFVLLILISVKQLLFLKFKKVFVPTSNSVLNVFFWASIIALLLAFAYPFRIQGHERWLSYAGPLKQLRAIGRFAWLFYYVINIIAFYKISQWVEDKKPVFKNVILFIALLIVSVDAYYTANDKQNLFNNKIAKLDDAKNSSPKNKWLTEINTNDYQAIIGLPDFHIGSENIWITSASEMMGDVFITSLQTGLPTTMVFLSRTSLGQTYKNIQMIKEPYRKLEIIKDFKNNKPFLVLAREAELNENEKNLLSKCKKIKSTPSFNVYELQVAALKSISDNLYTETVSQMNKQKTFLIDGFEYTDSVKTFIHQGFDEQLNQNSFVGTGCYEGKLKDYNFVFNDTLPNFKNEQEYTVSFWLDNYTEDMYPRTTCLMKGLDSAGSYNTFEFPMWYGMKIIDGNRALIENKIKLRNKKDHLAITIWHYDIADNKKMFRLDELFIRPSKDTIYKVTEGQSIMCNNRIYLAK